MMLHRPHPTFALLALLSVHLLGVTSTCQAGPCAPVATDDGPSLPEGVVGERLGALLEAVESGSVELIEQFVSEHFSDGYQNEGPDQPGAHASPRADLIRTLEDLHRDSQGFDFHGLRPGGAPGRTVAILQNRLTGAFEALTLLTEPAPPHRLTGLGRDAARRPDHLPAPGELDELGLVRELREFLERVSAAGAFSGTVLLARDGEVLFSGAHGLASRRFAVENRIDTRFNLGSMNKMFTAVAIAQLVERGQLAFDDSIDRYLGEDWLPNVDKGLVHIEHLLTHTSGLGSYFNRSFMEGSRELWREVDDYKPLVAGERLAFAPGSRWQYSNTGMLILGAVIEQVSGQNYFDYIREHIYGPADMTDSDSFDMDRPVPNLAIGYSRERRGDGLGWTNNLYQHVIRGGPAGGGFSTVLDLNAFANALLNHELLSEDTTELLLTPKPELQSDSYGYGFGIEDHDGHRVVGHSGGFSGISAKLELHLDTGYVVAVLSNQDGGTQIVLSKLRELLTRVNN